MSRQPLVRSLRRSSRSLRGIVTLVACLAAGPPALADDLEALRAELQALRAETTARIAALEARIQELEQAPGGTEAATLDSTGTAPVDPLQALREAARRTVAAIPPTAPPAEDSAPAGRRSLNALNPEISMTGIVAASTSDRGREEFRLEEMELDLQASLDPFSRTRFTLAAGPEEVEIEEAWVHYPSLPGGLGLTFGKFRQRFGSTNRQHLHALAQNEYAPVLTEYFGEEGLAQTGLSLSWLLPRGWASANELTVQITDGSADPFGGESFEHLVSLAHLNSFWEIGSASYLEWGLSGIVGGDGAGGTSRVWGTDWTYRWQPPGRSQDRDVVWRTEVLRSERDPAVGPEARAWGATSTLEAVVKRNLSLGVRVDRVEDPLSPERVLRGVSPYLTWWQSEFVRLRAQFDFLEDEALDETENRFTLQLTWAAGPHKHESY